MKHWCVWVWFTAGLFMACSSENQWLDTALNLAGDNRAELQKVLDRYKEEDGDKYRAACFLIENMPFHGAYEGKALENYRKYFSEYVSFAYSLLQKIPDTGLHEQTVPGIFYSTAW